MNWAVNAFMDLISFMPLCGLFNLDLSAHCLLHMLFLCTLCSQISY